MTKNKDNGGNGAVKPIRGRPSVLADDRIFNQVIESISLGIPQKIVADSLGVQQQTVTGWLKRKDFRSALGIEKLRIAKPALKKVVKTIPLAWLERHPDFREDWAPPKQQAPGAGDTIINIFQADLARRYEVIHAPVLLPDAQSKGEEVVELDHYMLNEAESEG